MSRGTVLALIRLDRPAKMDPSNATSDFQTADDTRMLPTSFVTEVLATAGRLEKEDLNAKLGKLAKRIDEVKMEVYEGLEKQYVRFYPDLSMAQDLNYRANKLTEDMDEVNNKIQKEMKSQLNMSTTEFHDLSGKLDESTNIVTLLGFLVDLHDSITASSAAIWSANYGVAAKQLLWMEEQLRQLKDTHASSCSHTEIKILQAIQQKYQEHQSQLVGDLGNVWSSSVKWTLPKQGTPEQVSLTLQSSDEAKKTAAKAGQAMMQLGILETKLKQFGSRLMTHVIKPIVLAESCQRCPEVKVNSLGQAHELTIQYTKFKKSKKQETLDSNVFSSLLEVLKFLNKNLFHITVQRNAPSVQDTENSKEETAAVSLMTLLGKQITEELLDIITNVCLARSIPTSNKDLDKFQRVIAATELFQKQLVILGIYPETNTALLDYVNNVNVLFANKKSQEVLEKSRALMTSEIHSMIKVTKDAPLGVLPSLLPEQKASRKGKVHQKPQDGVLAAGVQLSASTFRLPDCHISLSTQQLIFLAYEILNEAKECDEQCAVQLFYAVRSMFDLFCNVVPTYHEDSLNKLPQLAALHYNNCMYITHHLLIVGHQFKPHLPDFMRSGVTTFVDFVPSVRRLGTECFLKMMKQQRDQLLDYLSSTNGFVSMSEGENHEVAERAIRQVFHQLHHLGNVWRGVLPDNIYAQSIGTLLKSVMMEVVTSIVALEDISADDATQLASLINIITERSPDLFRLTPATEDSEEDEKEDDGHLKTNLPKIGLPLLLQHVPKWGQLLELRLLLNASLQEISDRWAEGKGLLADHFKANEVKQLIRALFQNTDRRATVLATIR